MDDCEERKIEENFMTLLEEIQGGANAALEFKESRPKGNEDNKTKACCVGLAAFVGIGRF